MNRSWRVFSRNATTAVVFALAMACAAGAQASTLSIYNLSAGGWASDDTRDAAGVNLVGTNDTHAGKLGQAPTTADDTAIETQIKFVAGPAGSVYGGAVSLDGTSGNNGKSNISVISPTTGFDAAGNLLTTFDATYEWFGQPNPTTRTLAFKLGIQSTAWAASQAAFTATRSGESVWDLVLVEAQATSDNAWSTVSLDHDSGVWNLFRQAGNSFFAVPSGTAKTLDDWAADATFGALLFGNGARVSSIQFGLGSSQKSSIAYVDYLQTNLLNGGDIIDFTNVAPVGPAAVPEPGTLTLLAVGLAFGGSRWRRSRALKLVSTLR